jgi:hypothetical protein
MWLRALILVPVFLLLPGHPASASVLVLPDGRSRPEPYQTWVDRARVPTPAELIELRLERCPAVAHALACTSSADDRIYMTGEARREELLHELGHRFDYRMPDWARDGFRKVMRDRRAWRSAPNSPHERFADAYAICARSPKRLPASYSSAFGSDPSSSQHRRVCSLARRAALADPARFDFPSARRHRGSGQVST